MTSEKIIIVDDEPDVLDLCRRILEGRGYQVKTARDGNEVIQLAQQERFDLLLTDIRMPGLSGLEVAQAVKKFSSDIICVTMTGFSTMDMAIEALKLGIDEFILKPFSPDELSTSIAKALEKERLRKENFRLRSLIPLFQLNRTLMGTVEVDKVLSQLLDISRAETMADFASLCTFERGEIVPHFEFERNDEKSQKQHKANRKMAQLVYDSGQQLILNEQNAASSQLALLEELEAGFVIATPLKSKETILGALILARKADNFAPSDSDFLAVLASQASIALENARLFSEIQEAYKELKILDHMKSEFINIAAHELRTPLAILMGYASMLEEDLQGHQRDYVATITRNSLRLSSLIDDMLSLQTLESGIVILAKDHLELIEAIQSALQDLALWIEEKKLTIHLDVPGDFPPMIVDRQKFDLIMVNLINNAVKFTPANGEIVLKASANGENATISITNTGISIPKEKLNRVFDRFYQIESSLTREHGGIGLGLAIVRGMVEVCGGEIRADSDEGKSTTFTFTLPLDNSHLQERRLRM
jgi:signal transduction histidine kinase/ActR/RegA family two-component response regulator